MFKVLKVDNDCQYGGQMKQPFGDYPGTVLVPGGSVEYEDGYLVKRNYEPRCFGKYSWYCEVCSYCLSEYECKIDSKENDMQET